MFESSRTNKIVDIAAKIFLFPILIFGLILRMYDKKRKANKNKK